jgi:hypothetical protein
MTESTPLPEDPPVPLEHRLWTVTGGGFVPSEDVAVAVTAQRNCVRARDTEDRTIYY